ncbi:type I restriction endonuclease [Ignatzschineria rhizosphaerae]|uniref:Type I restriction endonuclease n=1 Tax=Ignatzschineria rhizosphaerae TaxID=2923279 RepID=A0ABY3X1J1_9GAMM|nr:type I restriction enzyme HsdR N-terminal domain-containing protein [Ignatzschineria rhizosphaerae]UNM96744.1 type I restriction endonuclease [Ignatzschineria rhizosphaerae]
MSENNLDINNLKFDISATESDVEQKFITPFLTSSEPYGLNLSTTNFLTKTNINRYSIGKGQSEKIYYPDYILVNRGFPMAIIEAKKPSDFNLDEAYREARLYAHEVNDKFPKELNPVRFLLATNGVDLQFGEVGSSTPLIKCKVQELICGSKYLITISDSIGIVGLENHFNTISKTLVPPFIKKPRMVLGGKAFQEKEIKKNPLGETISDTYQWIFNPDNKTHRQYIVSKGYISTDLNKRNRYEVDQLVRLSSSASEIISQEIQRTDRPVEIYKALSEHAYNQIILLIGKVGVGKSTFIDYLQYTNTIPKSIQDKLIWVRLNLNNAPLEKEKIYSWIQQEIINNLQEQFKDEFDFESLEFLLKLYSVEVNSYKRGIGSIFSEDSEQYKIGLANKLRECESDLEQTLRCYIRHLANERAKSVIIVFDNCDKKNKDSQLLMFEVANWAKDTLKSIIFLPLRDETYDNYKDQKPLDTAIKQYSFRIEAPRFQTVLTRRVQLALDLISEESSESKPQQSKIRLKNDMYVMFDPNNDGSTYLLSMLNSVLNNENSIRRLLTGLSGGNIRIALEMFLNFCSSGHIPNEEIIKIRKSSNSYTMPGHIAVRALMRGNRRYYISKFSHIKNLLDAEMDEKDIPIYLIRLCILRWLKMMVRSDVKRSAKKGYFTVEELLNTLGKFGFQKDPVINQIGYLGKAMCITTEDFEYENINLYTNIKLAPAGYAHLELLENDITYLATIAEDTRITDENLVNDIKRLIVDPEQSFRLPEVYYIASKFIEYIDDIVQGILNNYRTYSKLEELENLISMEKPKGTIERFKSLFSNDESIKWIQFCHEYPIGTKLKGTIKNIVPHLGIFITLDTDNKLSIDGLIHKSKISIRNYSLGDKICVTIDHHDPHIKDKVRLNFAN